MGCHPSPFLASRMAPAGVRNSTEDGALTRKRVSAFLFVLGCVPPFRAVVPSHKGYDFL